jgi:thiol-disulfide isomerase/thioredoxin
VTWQVTFAQDIGELSMPGPIQPDMVYGEVGDWFVLRDLDETILPDSVLADRILFVNFWATWCGPCVQEMPTIVQLAEVIGDSSVAFLLISIDDSERAVRQFGKKHGLPVPLYLRGWKPGESTFVAGIVPATFIVNKNREIVYQHHGAADWNTDAIRLYLRELAMQ